MGRKQLSDEKVREIVETGYDRIYWEYDRDRMKRLDRKFISNFVKDLRHDLAYKGTTRRMHHFVQLQSIVDLWVSLAASAASMATNVVDLEYFAR